MKDSKTLKTYPLVFFLLAANNTVRRKVSMAPHSSCYSLTVSGLPTTKSSRSYTTNVFPDARYSRKDDMNSYSKKPPGDIVNKYLRSLTGQARKSGGSLKKFEPCYRPLYPSKKPPQPTYKIPRKLPYIPAVFQPRKKLAINYKQAKTAPRKHPVMVQWPPLYKSKKRNDEQKSLEIMPKTGVLPPWLLPLYSYKEGRPDDMVRLDEARFSGGAFHRRMEFLEGIKEIRNKQQTLSTRLNEEMTRKEVNKKPEPLITKNTTAVNDLKRRIGEMYAKMGSMKRSDFQKTQQIMKKTDDVVEGDKSGSNKDGVGPSNQNVLIKVSGYSVHNSLSLNQVEPQTLLSPQHPSEIQGTYKPATESTTVNFQASPRSHQMNSTVSARSTQGNKDQSLVKKEDIAIDSSEWSVHSLKSRINDMLTSEEEKLNKITSKYKEVVDVQKSSSDGIRAQVNRTSNRSFHRCSSKPAELNLRKCNSGSRGLATSSNIYVQSIGGGLQLRSSSERSYVGRRCLSSFSSFKGVERPKIKHSTRRRSFNQATACPMKKTNWITRVKRCFVIKRTKGAKIEDWKTTPRMIPYCTKGGDDTSYSPSPVLWVPKEKPATEVQIEKTAGRTNPVVLNAEQRIIASINRIVPTPVPKFRRVAPERTSYSVLQDLEEKSNVSSIQSDSTSPAQQDAVDHRLSEVEKKVRKAELKVSILPLPWPKEVKSAEKMAKLPELSGSQTYKLSGGMLTEMEKKEETGYEWMMNNKQIVEDIKLRSRQFAGKPLVPSHVKQSIEEYKLPLKAQIAQYRKSIERKAHGLYFYSTSRRWYSSSCCGPRFSCFCYPSSFFANPHPKFLHRYNVGVIGERKLSSDTSQANESMEHRIQNKPNANPGVDSEFYKKYALRPMYGDFSRDEPLNRLVKDPNSTRNWTNVTREVNPLPHRPAAPLTSPNKMLHKVGDTGSASLKKQVDDLKRLIRKSKGLDYVSEKVEDVYEPSQQSNESYELKLRKLVRAAQANAKKMKIVEPKYHTENNLLNNYPGVERRGLIHEPLKVHEPVKSVVNPSFPTFLIKPEKDSRIEDKSINTKPQVSRSISVDSFDRNKKPFSNMYSRIKSFVESVRRKSTHEIRSVEKNIPNNTLKGSISLCALLPSEATKTGDTREKKIVNQVIDSGTSVAPITVELRCGHIATPASSVQLWKAEHHPKPSVEPDASKPVDAKGAKSVIAGETSDHGELMSLLTRAKDLISFHSQLNVEEHCHIAKLVDRNPSFFDKPKSAPCNVESVDNISVKILSPEEIAQNLLTKPDILKFASEITETNVKQTEAKTPEIKTNRWPVLTFLPQSVFGKVDKVDEREINEKQISNQDGKKNSDTVQNSLPENKMAGEIQTPSIQSFNGTQENKTNLIYEMREATNETPSLAAVPPQAESISAHHLPQANASLIHLEPDSASEATSRTTSVEPKKEVPGRDRSVVDNQDMERYDSNVSVGNNLNLKTAQESQELVEQNNVIYCKEETVGKHTLETRVLNANDVSKVESSHSVETVLNGVASVNWGSLSKNFKNVLSRNAAKNLKYTEQCPPLPTNPKEMVTCEESAADHPSPQLYQTKDHPASIDLELDQTGNHSLGDGRSSCRQSDFQEPHLSSSSYYRNVNFTNDCSGISSNSASQMPNRFKYDVDGVNAEEEKVEAHIDEMNSHDRQRLAELLAQDPTINPELVKKLKLPVVFPEDCNEKTWCTRSRNS